MAAAGRLFIMTELRSLVDPASADDGERFEWSADTQPPGTAGGARACPRAPWSIGGLQHTVRTDYPNAKLPSEQVLGPRRKPFTLEGRFLDKWNFSGYAEAEMARLEAMCRRGNRVRFQYGNQTLEGIITEWDFPYRRPWDIGYSFTVSVHGRPEETDRTRVVATPANPTKAFDDLDLAVQAMLDVNDRAPRSFLKGTLQADVDTDLTTIAGSRTSLGTTIDNRALRPPEAPADVFTRIATQFRQVRADSYNLLLTLAEVRSDLDTAAGTAMSVLQFEDWTRSLRYAARIAMGRAREGDRSSTEHGHPSAVRLYRPQAGESLYAISRKFYGTPHAWRLIYERNALRTFTLLGTETLIIPERGGV